MNYYEELNSINLEIAKEVTNANTYKRTDEYELAKEEARAICSELAEDFKIMKAEALVAEAKKDQSFAQFKASILKLKKIFKYHDDLLDILKKF